MGAKTRSISFLASLAASFIRATLVFSAFAALALSLSTSTTLALAEAGEPGPLVHIETTAGHRLRGFLRGACGDSLVLTEEAELTEVKGPGTFRRITSLHLNSISSLYMPRRSRLSTGIQVGLAMGAVGALLGFASGDDPPGWISFTAGQKAGLLGSALGCIGLSIGGTYGALKGVDLDILWEGKSEAERAAILSDLKMGKYHCGGRFSISPWGGLTSPPGGKPTAAYGGRVRYYFTPRSGMELIYGRTGWSTMKAFHHDPSWSYTERSRMSSLSGGFFIYPVRTRPVKPFVAWGWGRTSTQTDEMRSHPYGSNEYGEWKTSYTESFFATHLSAGVEVPLTNHLGLEGRLVDIWALGEGHHAAFQLAMTLGSSY